MHEKNLDARSDFGLDIHMEPKSFSRRSFLRSSSAVTASTMLLAAGLNLPVLTKASEGVQGDEICDVLRNDGSKPIKAGTKRVVMEMNVNGTWTVVDQTVLPFDIAPGGSWDYSAGVSQYYDWRTRFEDT